MSAHISGRNVSEPCAAEVAERLLPVLARTRADRRVAFALRGAGSDTLDRCWTLVPEGRVRVQDLALPIGAVVRGLEGGLDAARRWTRLRDAAWAEVQRTVSAFAGLARGGWCRPVALDGGVAGMLFLADRTRPIIPLGAPENTALLDGLADLFEADLVAAVRAEERQAAAERREAEISGEAGELRDRAQRAEAELQRAQRALTGSRPRLDALEAAQTKATQLLLDTYTALARREEHLELLNAVFTALREVLEQHAGGAAPQELAAELVRAVSTAFGGRRCSLLLHTASPQGAQVLRMAAALGLPTSVDPSEVRIPVGEGISGWVASRGAELIVRDVDDASTLPVRAGREYNGFAFASLPLIYQGRFSGVLNLTNFRGAPLDDSHLEALRLVALMVALVVDHSRLNERLFALDPA